MSLAHAHTSVASFWSDFADQIDPDLAAQRTSDIPEDWEPWLRAMFPASVTKPFSSHHRDFWQHVWSIRRGHRPRPWVSVWPRGGAKSSSAELAVVALGARRERSYAVYVSRTQDQANTRVAALGALLESDRIATYYPGISQRAVGKFGTAKAWRRERMQTASGFVVDALGLDTAGRGLRIEAQRPDLLILDDIDSLHDTTRIVKKNIETLTHTILPIGAGDLAVIAMQNMIIPEGIFGKMVSNQAEFLVDRILSGPIPAIAGKFEFERYVDERNVPYYRITSGEPTWEGQSIAICEQEMASVGPRSFLREQQHDVQDREGALWTSSVIEHVDDEPEGGFVRIVIGVDPSGGGNEIGIVAAGMGRDGRGYVIRDESQPGRKGPSNWGRAVGELFQEIKADRIIAEKNFGGDMVAHTIQSATGVKVPVHMTTSSRGKAVRADPIAALYEEGRVLHVGVHPELEAEQTQWVPGTGESPNRVDALVFALTELFYPTVVQHRRVVAGRPPGL